MFQIKAADLHDIHSLISCSNSPYGEPFWRDLIMISLDFSLELISSNHNKIRCHVLKWPPNTYIEISAVIWSTSADVRTDRPMERRQLTKYQEVHFMCFLQNHENICMKNSGSCKNPPPPHTLYRKPH